MEKNTFKLQNKKVPSSGIVVETLSEKEPVRYGFGSWKPNFLQNLNNPKFLLFNFCIMVIVQDSRCALHNVESSDFQN
ncbi:hypothetical protein A3Q56_07955 [Intoshia linei]|uniref:Uncharacterized protein n=1 Tax=Intoshia linei TaxID=1819745 RepID=A0A177AQR0_9BILA|nr:hypothetical protein A3Q56_07955 [Intoshia linei]